MRSRNDKISRNRSPVAFPNLANPRRNKRCSSVHGMPFLLSCSCVSCCLEPPVPAVTCVPRTRTISSLLPPSEDFFFCRCSAALLVLRQLTLDGDPGTFKLHVVIQTSIRATRLTRRVTKLRVLNSLPPHGLVISSTPSHWLFGTRRPLSIARISSTN